MMSILRQLNGFLWPALIPALFCCFAQQARADESLPRTGILFYLTSQNLADLVLPTEEIRISATNSLHKKFKISGIEVLPYATMDRLVGQWRVRDDWSLNKSFLNDLAEQFQVDRLLVVQLRAERQNLSLLTRTVAVPGGELLRVQWPTTGLDLPEERFATVEPLQWKNQLLKMIQNLDISPVPVTTGEPLLVLPAEPVGCDPNHAMAATLTLMKNLLIETNHRMPDPALVYTEMAAQGISPRQLGAEGRRWLIERFACDELLKLTMISHGTGRARGTVTVIEDGPSVSGRASLPDFDLSLRLVHLPSGLITFGSHVLAPSEALTGWFGNSHQPALKERMQTSTLSLLRELQKSKEH